MIYEEFTFKHFVGACVLLWLGVLRFKLIVELIKISIKGFQRLIRWIIKWVSDAFKKGYDI